jgi:hypothetical protein
MNWPVWKRRGPSGACAPEPASARPPSRAFHINVGRLRDLEQGRTAADSALLAYPRIIDREGT